jgi:methyl-accepting chemotaxis protein
MTLAVMSTTAGALLVACLLFVLYDARTGRERLVERSEMLANVIAKSSEVALAFGDKKAAGETLEGLSGAKTVLAAAIYDQEGKRFTEYRPIRRGRRFSFPPLRAAGHEFGAGQLHVFEPIVFSGEELGSVYIAFDASALATRIGWYAMIVGVVMAGAALWSASVASGLRNQIARPLSDLAEGTRAIASGDLSSHVAEGRTDEIGGLARTFNEMTGSLRRVVSQTRQSIGAVSEVAVTLEERGSKLFHETGRQNAAIAKAAESVEQVSHSVRDLNESAERLAQTTRDTSGSIVEMDASIGEIAANMVHLAGTIDTTGTAASQVMANIDQVVTGVGTLQSATGEVMGRLGHLTASVSAVKGGAAECLELSEAASREASEGNGAVRETICAMGSIATSFKELQQRVDRLATKSQSIDEIVQVIKDVAEQTGLLALNASIIAARAGEHGLAFSVVAEQVSSLADRSHRSAREIADLIHAVQADTVQAVAAVDEGSAVVERGVERSQQAGEVLNRIIDGTRTSTERVREIANATVRQAEDLTRVDQAVHEVRGIVESIDRSAHQQHDATAEIALSVERVRELGSAVRQSTEEQRRGSHLITNASANLTQMAVQMAEALGEQDRSKEIIESTLRVFNDVSEETTRGVEAINASVATLSERAKQLEDEIGSFKVE